MCECVCGKCQSDAVWCVCDLIVKGRLTVCYQTCWADTNVLFSSLWILRIKMILNVCSCLNVLTWFQCCCLKLKRLNSVSHDALCFSVALVTALHVTRAVVELWGVATTSVPLAVTKVTNTHTHTHTHIRARHISSLSVRQVVIRWGSHSWWRVKGQVQENSNPLNLVKCVCVGVCVDICSTWWGWTTCPHTHTHARTHARTHAHAHTHTQSWMCVFGKMLTSASCQTSLIPFIKGLCVCVFVCVCVCLQNNR